MTTLQEQFEKDFPDKGVKWIRARSKYEDSNFTNYNLDLSEYVNLESLDLTGNKITSINLSECKDLKELYLSGNNLISIDLTNQKELKELILSANSLTSIDFLNQLPNPEKLKHLYIHSNNIQPTDISFFSRFVNLEILKIGTTLDGLIRGKRNQFYGSLKSYQNLTKLEAICIEATDINEGLEYLAFSLAQSTAKWAKENKESGGYTKIECFPHNANAKCKAIQDQLRPFNYDLEAWQLAHPELMVKVWKEKYFAETDSKDKWINTLTDKITNSQKELQEVKANEADKIKKITRLEAKISELEKAKNTISQQTQTEFSTQDKSTQTDLIMEQIKQGEQADKKTLYRKFIEKYGKK